MLYNLQVTPYVYTKSMNINMRDTKEFVVIELYMENLESLDRYLLNDVELLLVAFVDFR